MLGNSEMASQRFVWYVVQFLRYDQTAAPVVRVDLYPTHTAFPVMYNASVSIQIQVFWDAVLCGLLNVYPLF
jgi:hypothetical protein